jgi:hypothetical protein
VGLDNDMLRTWGTIDRLLQELGISKSQEGT